jgi:hypothetical protein
MIRELAFFMIEVAAEGPLALFASRATRRRVRA